MRIVDVSDSLEVIQFPDLVVEYLTNFEWLGSKLLYVVIGIVLIYLAVKVTKFVLKVVLAGVAVVFVILYFTDGVSFLWRAWERLPL
jgi:hypothetical protein